LKFLFVCFVLFWLFLKNVFKEKFFVVESGEAREKLKTDRGGRAGAGSTSRKQISRDHSVTRGMRTVDLCSGFKSS
jgi:hypothetical protein